MVSESSGFGTPGSGVLTERARKEDVVVAPPAHRTARQAARGQLGRAVGAATPKPRERRAGDRDSIDGRHDAGGLVDQHDVVAFAAKFVTSL
jgi:hypothetical protein